MFSNFLGVITFGGKMNEISAFSLLSPFIFYDFSSFRLLGNICLSPCRFLSFWDPLGSNLGTSGLPFGPLGFDLLLFWAPLCLPYAFLLVPFGSLLAPFGSSWLPFGSVWHLFAFASLWVSFARWLPFVSLLALLGSH